MATHTLRHTNGRLSGGLAGLSAWLGEALWTVSENVRPLLRSFSPSYGTVEPDSRHLSIREKSAIDGFRMGL